MNWWTCYLGIGILVFALVVAWDWYARTAMTSNGSATDRLIMLIAAMAVVSVWPVVLVIQLQDIAKYVAHPPQRYVKFKLSRRHLVRKVSIEEIEKIERVVDPLHAVPEIPFGFLNGAWRKFLCHLMPSDSLWVISARAINGFEMEEREGYAIARFGFIKFTMFTSIRQIGQEE